jgi:hypothetical protein
VAVARAQQVVVGVVGVGDEVVGAAALGDPGLAGEPAGGVVAEVPAAADAVGEPRR